jgi:HSP20 family protein
VLKVRTDATAEDSLAAMRARSRFGIAIAAMAKTAPAAHPVLTMPEPEGIFDQTAREFFESVARRAYELFESRGRQYGNDLEDWLQAESELLRPIPVEMAEEDGTLSLRAEIPGFNAQDLEIKLETSRLLIRGKKEQTTERKTRKTIYSEFQANEVFRVVSLPMEINPEKSIATLQDGILHVTLPKAAPAKPVRVEVKAAAVAA